MWPHCPRVEAQPLAPGLWSRTPAEGAELKGQPAARASPGGGAGRGPERVPSSPGAVDRLPGFHRLWFSRFCSHSWLWAAQPFLPVLLLPLAQSPGRGPVETQTWAETVKRERFLRPPSASDHVFCAQLPLPPAASSPPLPLPASG